MSKGRIASERVARLQTLFDAGDHGAVRRLAIELQADGAASAGEREAAGEKLARVAPDLAVVVAGLAGVATAVAITVWLLAHR
jgi:hypothetical protein